MPQDNEASHRYQSQVTEGERPTRNIAYQIQGKADAERSEKPAGVATHAVQAHRSAAQFLIGGLDRTGSQSRTVEIDRGVPDNHQNRRNRTPTGHHGKLSNSGRSIYHG